MSTPKSILRTSSFKTTGRSIKFPDEEYSMFSSILTNFKPPFMRKQEAKQNAAISIIRQEDERDDNAVDVRIETPCDHSDVSNLTANDERLNMSVAFDDMRKDDISTGVTFDLDHKVYEPVLSSSIPLEPIDQSLEITIENYIEYEELKRKRNKEENIEDDTDCDDETKLQKELESLRQLKERIEEEKLMQRMKVKESEEIKQKAFMDKVRKEEELVEKLKKRVADVKEATRVKKAEAVLNRAKEQMIKEKVDRIPAAPRIQDRLQSTVAKLSAANTTQDLIALDVAKIVARASNRDTASKMKVVPLTDNTKRLLPPPPVIGKMTLPNDYQYNLDIDPDPMNYVERLEYDDSYANESSCVTLESSIRGESLGIISRPGYIKPAPTSPRGLFF